MRFKDISSRFQAFYKKAVLVNFTKFTEKQSTKFTEKRSSKSLFFDKVLCLKKDSRTTAGRLFLLNTLYSLHPPQPQNVALNLGYSLMINYKHFQSKYCEPLRVRINKIKFVKLTRSPTAQLRIWPHLLKKSLMENFIFVQWPWNNEVAANKNYCN